MEKLKKITIPVIISSILIVLVLVIVVLNLNNRAKSNLEVSNEEELVKIVEKMYEGNEGIIPPSVQTQIVDTSDIVLVELFTGIQNSNDFEYLVVSEPMISSTPYSLILAKVKDEVDADKIVEEMKNKINLNKWVCVSAEQLYATSSGNVICLIMTNKETAEILYNKFKELAGTVGEEYEKVEEDIVLPPELYNNQ